MTFRCQAEATVILEGPRAGRTPSQGFYYLDPQTVTPHQSCALVFSSSFGSTFV